MIEEIRDILAKTLKIDVNTINEDSRIIEDLGADSLDFVDLLLTIEDRIGIVVEDEDAVKLKTVGDVAAFLESVQG